MKIHTKSAREPVVKPAPETVFGFDCTLMELVVGIDIITILANVLLSALSSVKARASDIACVNDCRRLQLCWQVYVNDHNDLVPRSRSVEVNGDRMPYRGAKENA